MYLKPKSHYCHSSQCRIRPHSVRQSSTVAHHHTSSHCYRRSPFLCQSPPPLISPSQTNNHSLLILQHDPPLEHYPQVCSLYFSLCVCISISFSLPPISMSRIFCSLRILSRKPTPKLTHSPPLTNDGILNSFFNDKMILIHVFKISNGVY